MTRPTSPPRPPDAPRPVPSLRRYASVRTWLLLLFGLPFLVNGVIITTIFIVLSGPPWDDWILDRSGTQGEATPTGVESTSSKLNNLRVQRIRYRWRDAAGVDHEGAQGTIDPALIRRARAGSALTVEYDPQHPARSRLAGERASFFGVFLVIPLAFGLIGLCTFGVGFVRARRERRIYRDGEAGLATVTRVRSSTVRLNRRPAVRIDYELQTLTAGVVQGSRLVVDRPAEGAQLWLLYDPENPAQHVLY